MLSMWFNTIPLQEDVIKYTYIICHLLYILLEYYVGKQECFYIIMKHYTGLPPIGCVLKDYIVNVHTVLTILVKHIYFTQVIFY